MKTTKLNPTTNQIDIKDLPLDWTHYKILICASMEQLLGAAQSALAGIIIPLMMLVSFPDILPVIQGFIGASGLIGIAFGSVIFGKLSDKYGYLFYFRLAPIMITLGTGIIWLFPTPWVAIAGLFISGLGLGCGYTLDTEYISELMPRKWSLFMCGVAKATSALGFVGCAGIAWIILALGLPAEKWNDLLLILTFSGLLTFLMRINFRNSPFWYLSHNMPEKADKSAKYFFGNNVTVNKGKYRIPQKQRPLADFFKGDLLNKVIFTGIPWACEGVSVYGVGVFLPVLVSALGMNDSGLSGMAEIKDSVKLTTIINSFMIPGFILGLFYIKRLSHLHMLTFGFWGSAFGFLSLLVGYLCHLPLWISILGFLIFELTLNAGPHLVTFILPAEVYDVANRGTGTGLSAMIGKVGAIFGVFVLPILLKWKGIIAVIFACIAVSVIGALVAQIYGRKVFKSAEDSADDIEEDSGKK